MAQIARWTTPAITYKPAEVGVADITEIVMAIRQNGVIIIRKALADAVVGTEDFTWQLSQAETSTLSTKYPANIKFDFTTATKRYTTKSTQYEVVNSAVEEAL